MHGLAVFVAAGEEDGVDDGDVLGLELAVAEPVALPVLETGAESVALAVAEEAGLVLAGGEPDGEPGGLLDGDDVGVHDGAGAVVGAWEAAWLAVSGGLPPWDAPGALGPAAGRPAVVAPVMAPVPPLLALPPALVLCPDITVELSCTMACRSGGTAMATPAANTAQANASAGRSIRSRQSHWDRDRDRD